MSPSQPSSEVTNMILSEVSPRDKEMVLWFMARDLTGWIHTPE